MSQHQPVFVEQPVASDWEVEETAAPAPAPTEAERDELINEAEVLAKYGLEEKALERLDQALCGEHFDVRVELTESFSEEPVECRLCYAVQQGDDVTWNCPYCGCGVDDDCGSHL